MRDVPRPVLAMLVSMAARMGIPLVPALAIHLAGGPLANAGLLYYLLVFYPITLAVDVALSLPSTSRAGEPTRT
jgi:hypothetical protein